MQLHTMNGLTPKISRSGANKPKNNIGSPIVIRNFHQNIADENCASIKKFLDCASGDEQLGILKNIIDEQKNTPNKVIEFLAIVFYEAPAKHPVKCFLMRHVTKCSSIQKAFSEFLSAHILSQIDRNKGMDSDFENYAELVPKVVMCIENFPAGTAAVECVGVKLLIKCLFLNYFICCRKNLRKSSLSPTKKNEMFNLEHLMLRLLVHIIQKLNLEQEDKHSSGWEAIFQSITYCVEELICDEELPMDTKSLSGILLLSVETLKMNRMDAWKRLLEATENHPLYHILKHKAGQLAVYSAIATTVPMKELQEGVYDENTPAILVLLDKLLSFADGNATEPALTLSVARSLHHLSKSLDETRMAEVGPRVVPPLLTFVWPHLEYHLDSVRHLTQQILSNVLEYCADLEKRGGDPAPLAGLLRSVRALGRRRSFYWTVASAARALGAARVRRDLCPAPRLLPAAAQPHLHAAVSGALAALVSRDEGGAAAVLARWVRPALPLPAARDVVLAAAVAAHPDIVTYISQEVSGDALLWCCRAAPQCRARLPHRTLRAAAVGSSDETRLLALSLVVESRRSTEPVSRAELAFVLTFLRYNINAQQPGFRHAMLAHVKKLLKRLEDSYRAVQRRGGGGGGGAHYAEFVEGLRALCYGAALRGANYGRRSAALQLLTCVERLNLAPHRWVWKEEYVETLLQHLDDSYDTNKAFALQVLEVCPEQLFQKCYGNRVELGDILRQARSARPADSAAAAHKLRLALARAPAAVLRGNRRHLAGYSGEASLAAAHVLVQVLVEQVRVASREWHERGAAPGLHGPLHCLAVLLRRDDVQAALSGAARGACVRACGRALAGAAPAVAAAAPEAAGSTITLEDGQPITSQMVLLCAWRTVKEAMAVVSAVSGAAGAGAGAGAAGRRAAAALLRLRHRGALDHAAAALHHLANRCWVTEELRHLPRVWLRSLMREAAGAGAAHRTRRGAGLPAAIQALVSSEIVSTGRAECFHECMTILLQQAAGAPDVGVFDAGAPDTDDLDADELDADDLDADIFDVDAVDADDADADTDAPDAEVSEGSARRTLAANILRALFRHSALEGAAQAHVSAGLRVAICGFDAAAWPERTAMSLLFAALAVRTFGVARARGAALDARNKMSGRVFYRRHPALYGLMLSKLEETRSESDGVGGGSVYPVLLLLARLYPSALEGAVSNLKVCAFVPPVERLARGAGFERRAAAAALAALLARNQIFPHIERMFDLLSDPGLERNHCHGVLLQLARLLETPPDTPERAALPVAGSLWILAQAVGSRPCYVIAQEYANVINLLVWRFPESIENETIASIKACLKDLLYADRIPPVTTGREICLADCLYLYLILLHRDKNLDQILEVTQKTLQHKTYEVVLASLNYLLILHGKLEIEDCKFQEHLTSVCDGQVLDTLRKSSAYISMLKNGLYGCKYLECQQKCLRLLILENDTQLILINKEVPSSVSRPHEWMISELIQLTDTVHENVTHMYLESLLKLTSAKLGESGLDVRCLLDVVSVAYARSSAENGDGTRLVVVSFLETNLETMMTVDIRMPDVVKFEYRATILATLATLLEDDDEAIRQRTADVVAKLVRPVILGNVTPADSTPGDSTLGNVTPEDEELGDGRLGQATLAHVMLEKGGGVLASVCGELLRDYVESLEDNIALFVALALLDFNAEVCMTDELTDEGRVFDQSERYNIFLEETVWTAACADKIIKINQQTDANLVDYVLSIRYENKFKYAFQNLCNENFVLFEKMAKNGFVKDETINPKVELFIRKLRG